MSSAIVIQACSQDGKELVYVTGFETFDDNLAEQTYKEIKNIKDQGLKIGIGMWSIELYKDEDIVDCFPTPSYEGHIIVENLKQTLL